LVRPVRSLSLVYTGDVESSPNLAFVLTRPLDFKHQEDCSALRLDRRPPRHLRGVYSAEPPHPRLRRVGGCSVHQLLHPLPVGGYLVHQLLPSRQRRVVYSAEPLHPPLQRGGGCSVHQHLPLMPVEGSLDQLRLVSSSIARLFILAPVPCQRQIPIMEYFHIYACCLNHSTIRKRIRSRYVFRIPSTLSIHPILTLIHNAYCSRFPSPAPTTPASTLAPRKKSASRSGGRRR